MSDTRNKPWNVTREQRLGCIGRVMPLGFRCLNANTGCYLMSSEEWERQTGGGPNRRAVLKLWDDSLQSLSECFGCDKSAASYVGTHTRVATHTWQGCLWDSMKDLRTSRRWLWRIPYSGMLHPVALVRTDVSDERNAFIMRVTRINELGTTDACLSLLTLFLTHQFLSPWWWRRYVPPIRWFSQEPHSILQWPLFVLFLQKLKFVE
jgi:hypothetical protein